MTGLDAALTAARATVFDAVDAGLVDATDGLKADLRTETELMLGVRVGRTWRSRFYPNKGDGRGPAGFVWSKAPRIISFWSADRVVTPQGRAFAIPVNPVIQRRGRPMTIFEVETQFNQDLIPRRLPSGNIGLFANLTRARSGKGFRQSTPGRRSQGRHNELVLMFVLVRSLRSRKLIDLNAIAQKWGARAVDLIGDRLARGI